LTAENLKSYDLIMIITNHDDIDYKLVGQSSNIIIDTRNVMADYPEFSDKVFKA